MKPIKQKDNKSCGPIAIINVLKKFKFTLNSQVKTDIIDKCGSDIFGYTEFLRMLGVLSEYVYIKTSYKLFEDDEIDNFIVIYSINSNEHYSFIYKMKCGNYKICNYMNNKGEYVHLTLSKGNLINKLSNKINDIILIKNK
jgi:predicted double-glycine peptidase